VDQEVIFMFFQHSTEASGKQTAEEESQWWAQHLETYLAPYSERLDAYLDRRVVGNLMATVAGIIQTRSELTTSELGSAICGPEHAAAGTQRLQRALHHEGWKSQVIWDSSVLEKPESISLQGLGNVRSSRVKRLARTRHPTLQPTQRSAGECARL
jgi:hypothetical protein